MDKPFRFFVSVFPGEPRQINNEHDGCLGAWLLWDFVRIRFQMVRDGHRMICPVK